MSDIRVCPSCGEHRGGYYGPPIHEAWVCHDCQDRRLRRARHAVLVYAADLNAGEPQDENQYTTHAIDLIADLLHLVDDLDDTDPHKALDVARNHYDIERLGLYEENL